MHVALLRARVVTCAVVVEDLREDSWDLREDSRVTVKEVLVKHAVVVGLRVRQTSQSRGRNLPQRGAVDLMSHAADVHAHLVTRHRHVNSHADNNLLVSSAANVSDSCLIVGFTQSAAVDLKRPTSAIALL